MSFFNWFSGKSRQAPGAANIQAKQAVMGRDKLPVSLAQRLAPETGSREAERKSKRHASREQLYAAIREAMTRVGVLSASYKFKVLSLDQRVNDYLVMIDLTRVAGDPVSPPGEMEALIVQSAKVRYDIKVSAVYWRLNEVAAVSKTSLIAAGAVARSAQAIKQGPVPQEPMQEDEMTAFQRALLAASANGPTVALEKNVKVSSGLRFSAQLAELEDTEVFESASYPALSNTQYGDPH